MSLSKFKLKKLISLIAIVLFVTGCATSKKIQPVQIGDNSLTKEQLLQEIQKLDLAQQEVDSKKGITGTNVASALFWVPGLFYTYYDAGEATRLISERRSHLTELYNQKYAKLDSNTISSKKSTKTTS